MGVEAAVRIERPLSVGMQHVVALPLVCSLGAAKALGARVMWPSGVVDEAGEKLCQMLVSVRYEDGLLVEVSARCDEDAAAAVEAGIIEALDAWEAAVAAGRAQAGPLAPVLGELFDFLWRMGEQVSCTYPNGRVFAKGRLAGIDVWGRLTVVTDDGRELEFSPEQAGIK